MEKKDYKQLKSECLSYQKTENSISDSHSLFHKPHVKFVNNWKIYVKKLCQENMYIAN